MPPSGLPPDPGPAESIFASWVAEDTKRDFEEIVREHPRQEAELRKFHRDWMHGELLRKRAGLDAKDRGVRERPRAAVGEGIVPGIAREGEQVETPSGSTSELLKRLAEHGVKSPRYKLEGEVARGGQGAILRVWDEDLRRHLAMKVVLGTTAVADSGKTPQVPPAVLSRFLEEAQITGQLDHPGIVPVHELGLDADGRVYFTMKLVKGRDLKAIFDLVFQEKEGWNETRALGAILKACEAMAYAHKKGVIHRDLKPANIMVGDFGEVFVMDWGAARVLGREDTHDIRIAPEFTTALSRVETERSEELSDSPIRTVEGAVVGTPAYMPPEQARGEIERLSPRSDVYAIGAMLYHLLARHAPYMPRGARVSDHAVLVAVMHGPPDALSTVRKDVPGELVAIVEKAMAREAERRYADTLALAEDLRAYLENRVVGAYETGAWAETRKWVHRNKPLAGALASAVLLLVAGLSVSLVFKARADEKERLATQRANDILSLSAIQDLKDLEVRAYALWPADPENVPKYEEWLSDARVLIEGQPGDPSRGLKKRPSLAEHEAKLAEIRTRAKPHSPEQAEADRRSNPSFAEWENASAQLLWMRRMLGKEPWPEEAEMEARLSKEKLPTDASSLNTLAWLLVDVDPAKVVYGSEVRGLILARQALAGARESERAGIRDTLGWALYRCGRFDEALAEEQRAVDEAHGKQKEQIRRSLRQVQEHVGSWKGTGALSKQSAEESRLSSRVADLRSIVEDCRTYYFENGEDRWWEAQLSNLVSDLRSFTDEKTGGLYSAGTSEEHGWGITKRAELARKIQERSVDGPQAKRSWNEAISKIAASPKYGGLRLEPQLGLLPIGPDPESGLWEFAHLATGEPAERGADGRLVLKESIGLVFVLIPGGTFWMGAQKADPNAPNYDPQARDDESPVHEVTLSPYFLSKYEMTQGQWERFAGRNPSGYGPSSKAQREQENLLHPVENVSWTQCTEMLSRLALELPSEAQWEYGGRGGTGTTWWTGSERETLRGKVNLADQTAARAGADWEGIRDWPDLEDGWAFHAPVGSFPANRYGLHDVCGNVAEWCRDGYTNYAASEQFEPVASWNGTSLRVQRGGCYYTGASVSRSASRYSNAVDNQYNDLGLRPARAIRRSMSSRIPAGK